MQQALGLIETKGLVAAIESADAMLKAANVTLLEKTIVGGGLVSVAIAGDVGAVKASVEAGAAAVAKLDGTLLVSQHVIPRPHEDLDNIIVTSETKSNVKPAVEIPEEAAAVTPVAETAKFPEEVSEKLPAKEEEPAAEVTVSAEPESSEVQEEKIDLKGNHRKETIDRLVAEKGIEEVVRLLNRLKVVELRNLAREYKDFSIVGRKISKADKNLLITEFRKYYGKRG